MKKATAALFLAMALSPVLPVRAAEAPAPESANEQEPKEMPGWAWANFAILAAGLGYLAVKHARPYFARETSQIRSGLEDARRRRRDADLRVLEVEERLSNLDADVASFRQSAAEERDRAIQQMRQRLASEIEFVRNSAQAQIEYAGRSATLDLRRHASRLAVELAEQRLRSRMNPGVQSALSEQFIEGLRA